MACQRYIISLEDIRLEAPFGVMEEERRLGNTFLLTVESHCMLNKKHNENFMLKDIVDYRQIYQIAQNIMSRTEHIMENIATSMAQEIFHLDTRIEQVDLYLRKLNPPLGTPVYASSVKLSVRREDFN